MTIRGLVIGVVSFIVLIILVAICTFTIKAGYVGVGFNPFKGGVQQREYQEGLNVRMPWVKIDRFNVKTQEFTMSSMAEEGQKMGDDSMNTVSKDGLYVTVDITVLFKIMPQYADQIRQTIGREGEYQQIVVRPNIRSVVREVISQYNADEVYGESRSRVQASMHKELTKVLTPKWIEIESVLLRDVQLPSQLVKSIEEKKQAEQDALRMEYIIQKEALERDRKVIEAGGIAEANEIIAESLTAEYLTWYWLQQLPNHESVIYMLGSDQGLPLFKNVDSVKKK